MSAAERPPRSPPRTPLRRVAALLSLALCATFCLTQLAEVDLFWHLLAGSRILDEGRVPRVDDFTYTSAGRAWVDLHWLFQVIVGLALRVGGWAALDSLKVILIATGFACALLAALKRRSTAAAPFLLMLGAIAAQERFTLRPEAASFCLLGILVLVLALRETSPRAPWLLPALFVVWANVHSLYAAGLGVLVLTLAGDALDAALARLPSVSLSAGGPRPRRPLLVATALSVVASLATPYGVMAWSLSRRLLLERIAGDNVLSRNIAEFQAPFGGFGRTAAVWAFGALAAIVVAGIAVAWRSCRCADVLVPGAFLVLALLARRNMALFALVALPAGALALAAARDRLAISLRKRRPGVAAWMLERSGALLSGAVCLSCAILLADVTSNRFYARDGTQRGFGCGIAPGFYPEAAAGFVLENRLPGEIFNDLTMGGYLAWRFHPERRVYIDGRLEVHDAALFSAYMASQQDPRQFERQVERFGIRTVVWSHRHALDAAPLLRHLAGGQGWRLAHVDLAAAVFTRAESGGGEVVALLDRPGVVDRLLESAARAEESARADDPVPAWVRRVWPRVEVPAAEVGAGLFFALIGRPALAEPLFADAARRAPWSPELRFDLGLVLAQSGRPTEAREAFEAALRLDPGLGDAAAALAMLRLGAGDEDGALQDLDRAARGGAALPAAARQARGAILARRGRIGEAIADYREAIRLNPEQAAWRAELAVLLAAQGMPQQARAEIERALALDPEGCAPRVAAARVRGAFGDLAAAEAMLRAAGAGDAPCGMAQFELARLLAGLGRRQEAARAAAEALRLGVSPSALAAEPTLRGLAPGS